MEETFDAWCLRNSTTEQERSELKVFLLSLRLKRLIHELDPIASVLVRTIASEAERTGSWEVPEDLRERINLLANAGNAR